MNRLKMIEEVRKIVKEKLTEEGFEVEENTYFELSSYSNIRDKNNPRVRAYMEISIIEGAMLVLYYDNWQVSYPHYYHDYNGIARDVLKHFKDPYTESVSGAAKPSSTVEDHFSKWEDMVVDG